MKNGLVLGKPNAGKTLFIINFASFLGVKRLEAEFIGYDGVSRRISLTPEEARREWVSDRPHKTRKLVHYKIHLSSGRRKKQILLTDSTAIVEGVPADAGLRRAFSQTFFAISRADLIIHIVDTSLAAMSDALHSPGEADLHLAEYGLLRKKYLLLANKTDLPGAEKGLHLLKNIFAGAPIIAVSALKQTGFTEVREHLAKLL